MRCVSIRASIVQPSHTHKHTSASKSHANANMPNVDATTTCLPLSPSVARRRSAALTIATNRIDFRANPLSNESRHAKSSPPSNQVARARANHLHRMSPSCNASQRNVAETTSTAFSWRQSCGLCLSSALAIVVVTVASCNLECE